MTGRSHEFGGDWTTEKLAIVAKYLPRDLERAERP